MSSPELDKVELPAFEQLQALGWQYLEGVKLSRRNRMRGIRTKR